MIQIETKLKNYDNTGVSLVKCLKTLNTKRSFATTGDIILVAVQKIQHAPRLKKKIKLDKKIQYGLIISVKKKKKRADNCHISFDSNRTILLTKASDLTLLGSRIFGPMGKELKMLNSKKNKYKKILAHSEILI